MVIKKILTKTSLFEPLEIDIDGNLYRIRPITLGALEKIQDLQIQMSAGSAKAIREMLETVIEGDIEALRNLPVNALMDVITVIAERAIKPNEVEKNGSGPADKSTP